jgi:hypothetical protein
VGTRNSKKFTKRSVLVPSSLAVSSDSSFNKEDHIFGNVGGDVGDALQALGNLHHVDGLGGARDILLNEFP